MSVIKNCVFCKYIVFEDEVCLLGRGVDLMTTEPSLECTIDWQLGKPDCENCKHFMVGCENNQICLEWKLRNMEQWLNELL